MTRVEAALAACDRLSSDPHLCALNTAMLRIGRDVLTRHTPYSFGLGTYGCDRGCADDWPCAESRPWLDLLAPEPTP